MRERKPQEENTANAEAVVGRLHRRDHAVHACPAHDDARQIP